MSYKTALVALKTANMALNTLVGVRFYANWLPQNVAMPCVKFQKISAVTDDAMGPAIVNNKLRIQMDGYVKAVRSGGTITIDTLRDALIGTFYGYSGTIG